MTVETDADRAAFVDVDDFGVAATYTPAGGTALVIHGIFDAEYNAALGDIQALVATDQPQFLCRTSDVAAARHGDALAIGGASYVVVEVRPDGTGMTVLVLNES